MSGACRSGGGVPISRIQLVALITLLTLLLALAGCGPEDPAWARVQETGVLRVGMDAAYPPFESLDENGQVVGFDVDMAREIGRRLGLEVQFVNIAYDGLYDALVTGQVDVLISALVPAYGTERARFSEPYFNAGDVLVVPPGSSIEEMRDLGGRTLAVEYGSGGDVEARKWERRVAALTVERYDTPASALDAVLAGEADAALVDGISARLAVGQHPDDLMLAEGVTETLFAIAVHEDSNILLREINTLVEEMSEDGTRDALTQKWFGAPY